MCGILGLFDFDNMLPLKKKVNLIEKGLGKLRHRGPDDEGVWVSKDKKCLFGHRRLSIIDRSSRGHQPMESFSKRVAITYNGELYNSEDIQKKIQFPIEAYQSNTDTEILLEAYEEMGETLFNEIDAMYAVGFYHQSTQTLTLARDPFGEKPLYYYQSKGIFAFASEMSALEVLIDHPLNIDEESLEQYLLLQYVHAPKTFFKEVSKLEPATYLKITSSKQSKKKKYFEYLPKLEKTKSNESDLLDELEFLLTESVTKHVRCDTPYGSFLSGGVDSSILAVIAKKNLGLDLNTFSMGFENFSGSEHLLAAQTASYLKTKHRESILPADVLFKVQKMAELLDEPNADTSFLSCFYLSEFSATKVRVSLSGDGGDELFGGYKRYAIADLLSRKMKASKINSWQLGNSYFSDDFFIFSEDQVRGLSNKEIRSTDYFLKQLRDDLNQTPYSIYDALRKKDLETYLPGSVLAKMDRASMLNSLEVRSPFLAKKVVEFSTKLSSTHLYQKGSSKYLLRKLLKRMAPKLNIENVKRGFGIPKEAWNAPHFRELAKTSLLTEKSALQNYLDIDQLKVIFSKSNEKQISLYQAWSLLILEFWLRKYQTE